MTRPIIGTSSPIYVPREADGNTIRPGQDYFLVQILGAQASFTGSIWERAKRLIVISQVNLNHSILGDEALRALQRSREVRKDHAEQLGLRPNLIELVPAVMPSVSISVEFILDKENRLATLSGLINDDSFLASVSLAPGAATVARTVGSLAQKVIQSFVPAEEREPLLQFNGDFNLAVEGLRDGYYVILGTRDEQNPIPSPLQVLEIRDGELLANGKRVTQLSYVILDVRRVEARTRDLNDGAIWDAKLREAESLAVDMLNDPLAEVDIRKQTWQKCRNLLREAQAILRADPNYHRWEANSIIEVVYLMCSQLVSKEKTLEVRRARGIASTSLVWAADFSMDRDFLGISPDEDLFAAADRYPEQVAASRRVFREAGIADSGAQLSL